MHDNLKIIAVFLTNDVSFSSWERSGILHREIAPYLAMEKEYQYVFFSYGSDCKSYQYLFAHSKIVSVYANRYRPKVKILRNLLVILYILHDMYTINRPLLVKSNQMRGAWVPAIMSIFFRLPFYFRCGYEWHRFEKFGGSSKIRMWVVSALSRFVYKRADKIQVASKSDKNYLKSFFSVPSHKITVQHNWVMNNSLSRSRAKPAGETPVRICAIGRIVPQKDYIFMSKVGSLLSEKIDVYGSGCLNNLEELTSIGESGSLNFLGSVVHDKLQKKITTYKYFFMTSLYEGNPKALLEAMSLGVVPIVRNAPGVTEIVSEISSLLLCDTPSDFQCAMRALDNDDKLYDNLRDRCGHYILEKCSFNQFCNTEREIIEGLLK